jgi:hypothetical protein
MLHKKAKALLDATTTAELPAPERKRIRQVCDRASP